MFSVTYITSVTLNIGNLTPHDETHDIINIDSNLQIDEIDEAELGRRNSHIGKYLAQCDPKFTPLLNRQISLRELEIAMNYQKRQGSWGRLYTR